MYFAFIYIQLSAFANAISLHNNSIFACNISKSSLALHMLKFATMGKWRLGKCINEPACKKSVAPT